MAVVQRFLDADKECAVNTPPLPIDFEDIHLTSLDDAVTYVSDRVKNVRSVARDARKDWTLPDNSLTADESLALRLYTMEWITPHKSISTLVNESLRSKTRLGLDRWLPYLRLLVSALNKLEPISCTVYRGAPGDLRARYRIGHAWWWGLTSCSRVKGLERELGRSGPRTIFVIDCVSGRVIGNHAHQRNNNEVLLLPGTYFRVCKHEITKTGSHLIFLSEETPPNEHPTTTNPKFKSVEQRNPADGERAARKARIDGTTFATESHASGHTHPACQFRADQHWFECQYHAGSETLIKKPNEMESDLRDPPMTMPLPAVVDRIRGSLMAMTLGDALGAHVEFRPHKFLLEHPVTDLEGGGTWGLEKGQFTDDTSMALCLGISLVVRHDFVPYDQLVRYKWWFRNGYMSSTGQCFDIGAATKTSIVEFERRQREFARQYHLPVEEVDFLSDVRLLSEFKVYCSEEGVAGNGALMRLAPVPLFFWKFPSYAVELAGQSGLVTHGDRKAYDACRYYAALIVAALAGAVKDELTEDAFYDKHKSWFNGKPLCPEIMAIAEGSYKRKNGYDGGIRGKGYVVDALEAALWAFYHDGDSFKTGALEAVNLGDDTDTTAAIYGQLAGACYGYRNLPPEWVQQVYAKDFIHCLSNWITHEGQTWRPEQSLWIKTHPDMRNDKTRTVSLPPVAPKKEVNGKPGANPPVPHRKPPAAPRKLSPKSGFQQPKATRPKSATQSFQNQTRKQGAPVYGAPYLPRGSRGNSKSRN